MADIELPLSNREFGAIKRTRTNAYNHLKAGAEATDQFIRDTGDDLEELESHLDLLKTRYSEYVAAHERVFAKATDEQLPEADQIALNEAHDEMRRLHEASRTKIKSRKRQFIRAKDAAKEQTEAAAATQRETTARQNRITSLEQVLTQLYAKQVQEQNAMDGAIVQAARYAELVRFAAGFKIMHDRLIQADEVINEIAQLDPTKTMELDNRRFEKRSELTEKEAVIKYELLRKIQVSEERENLFAVYPELRPTPTPSVHEAEANPGAGPEANPGTVNIAEIVAAVTGAMQGTRINQNSTIKKQEPPKFSGHLEDYPRFKRHWDNMVSENRITIPQQLRILEESLPASNKVIRTQVANCQSTDAAWAILQAKFGNSEDLLQNRMSLLEDYISYRNNSQMFSIKCISNN